MNGSPEPPGRKAPALDVEVRLNLGKLLGEIYDHTREAELPARFQDLLAKLIPLLDASDEEGAREFREGIVSSLPKLRSFAVSLTMNRDRADDLVQEAVIKALGNMDKYQRGTNLQGWLFVILRNEFHNHLRKKHREVEDADGQIAGKVAVQPEQQARAEHRDLITALSKLTPSHREALLLVGAEGISYDEVAEICGVAVGTIKSRVSRARNQLAELLSFERRTVPG